VTWDAESGEKGQVEYNGIKGIEAVRAELEKGISGKEVSWEVPADNRARNPKGL